MNNAKTYTDRRGWRFRVMPGIGGDVFKARYQKPDAKNWHGVATLPWRESMEAAQADLDRMAQEKGWEAA